MLHPSSETVHTPRALLSSSHPGDVEPAPTLLRRGDKKSFDLLYYRYAPRVLGLLLRLTGGDRSEAEDLTQETFLASFAACATYAERGKPLSWLLGIAVRRWRDKQRTQKPSALPLSEALPSKREVEGPVLQRASLEDALAHLEPAFRDVLLLIAGQQLSYKEVAEITGEPLGTVKWRFHEATRKMRRLLQDDELAALQSSHPATSLSQHSTPTMEDRNESHEPRAGTAKITRSGSR